MRPLQTAEFDLPRELVARGPGFAREVGACEA